MDVRYSAVPATKRTKSPMKILPRPMLLLKSAIVEQGPPAQALGWLAALVVLLLGLGGLAGCSGPREAPQRGVELTITGGPEMNGGNAARVRVYQLSGTTRFLNASVGDVWNSEQSPLEAEVVEITDSFLLYPNQTRPLEVMLENDTRYLGVAADLREPEQDRWRQVVSAEEIRGRDSVGVTIGRGGLVIELR